PDSGLDAGGSNDAGAACSYPPGAVEPMALEEILSPYRWPELRSPATPHCRLGLRSSGQRARRRGLE
ncbi:MAG: hypothetical protein AAFZ18_32415, partial [Myxococcota bacterium]